VRSERELLVLLAQHSHEPSHLGERLLARALDRVERGAGLVRLRLEQAAGASRLKNNHADRVGDDVVELAGNASALVGNRVLGRTLLSFKRPLADPSAPHRPACHPRTADDQREVDDGREVRLLRIGDQQGEEEGKGKCAGRDRPAAARVRSTGVDGQEEEEPGRLDVAEPLREQGADGDETHEHREEVHRRAHAQCRK
jgi:hypothetical protein